MIIAMQTCFKLAYLYIEEHFKEGFSKGFLFFYCQEFVLSQVEALVLA